VQSVEADCDDRIIFEDYCRFIRKENGFLLYIFPSKLGATFLTRDFLETNFETFPHYD